MQELLQKKKRKLIEFLSERNVLVSPELLEKLNSLNDPEEISSLINHYVTETTNNSLQQTIPRRDGKVRIIFSYPGMSKKANAQDFINYFNSRYNSIKKILQQRTQLENVTSIGKLRGKNEKEQVAVIGMVMSKEDSKNGLMVTVEDPTGSIKVFFSKNKLAMMSKAKDIVLDEVLGISGSMGKNIIFANESFSPDIPHTKEMKKSPEEEYVVFISDIHVGSKRFMEDEFMKFIKWINGEIGNEKQRELASKVKYVFVTGDAIDGISVYPTQREELKMFTFKEQYKKLGELLKLIPSDIKIILCPGQHDVVPVAEPQPPLPEEYAKDIFDSKNITLVSNPAIVNIASKEGFPGFDVLMYHGASYNHYADEVESIRIQKPNISERAELVMKLLLSKRHLSPTYDGNPLLPTETDHMIIEKIPDIFVSGDVHRSAIFNYKGGITGIIGSCFQAKTSFQDKVGHVPDPGRVPIINLQTREAKLLNFSITQEQKEESQDG